MLAVTKAKQSGGKKISEQDRVTGKFLEVSRYRLAKQWQRNVQKKCVARAKLFLFFFFLLIRPIVFCFFFLFSAFLFPLPSRLSQHYTILYLFQQTIDQRELRFQPWLNLYIRIQKMTKLFFGKKVVAFIESLLKELCHEIQSNQEITKCPLN